MSFSMRRRLWPLFAAQIFLFTACNGSRSTPIDEQTSVERIDQSLARAVRYLLDRQGENGEWRSDVYGSFKDGDALTPLVLEALLAVQPAGNAQEQCRKGADYLAGKVRPGGAIDVKPPYPVYTASLTVVVLSRLDIPEHRTARDAWLNYLREQQLTEKLGWHREDLQFGGWGYAKEPPLRPAAGRPVPTVDEPNLSATVFALEALRAGGCTASDPAVRDAAVFVQRCQNFSDQHSAIEAALDDGGFFFIHGDMTRNKGGVAGVDRMGRTRYVSYGSTTADGLRALLLCDLAPDHPRVVAAKCWLAAHFDSEHHPGSYPAERKGSRPALDYYYSASLARAFRSLGVHDVATSIGTTKWAPILAKGLLDRQSEDGSWSNPVVDVREDDPLVSTPLAILALAICREHLRGTD